MADKDYSVQYTVKTYAEQYKRTKATQVAERKEILRAMFDSLNKSKAASGSPEVIDFNDVKDLDDEFKKIMGLTSSSGRKYSEEDFNNNVGLWVDKFAKWEEPKAAPPPAPAAKPIPKADRSLTTKLASDLIDELAPPGGGFNWFLDMVGDDNARAKAVRKLFTGEAYDYEFRIDAQNVVEVFEQIDLKTFRKGCNLLDDKGETSILSLVKGLINDRIELLEDNNVAVPQNVKDALGKISTSAGGYWSNGDNEKTFDTQMTVILSGLRGLGVQK